MWIADPRDAQYLNCEPQDLKKSAAAIAAEGLIKLADGGDFAGATPALLEHRDAYVEQLQSALDFTKPSFNEEMRAGHTNM